MKQGFQVFPEIIYMSALFVQALCLVGAAQSPAPCKDHQHCQEHGRHSVEQDQDGLVALCIHIHLKRLVPVFFLGDCPQASQQP